MLLLLSQALLCSGLEIIQRTLELCIELLLLHFGLRISATGFDISQLVDETLCLLGQCQSCVPLLFHVFPKLLVVLRCAHLLDPFVQDLREILDLPDVVACFRGSLRLAVRAACS